VGVAFPGGPGKNISSGDQFYIHKTGLPDGI
jgi:hypothetical protein